MGLDLRLQHKMAQQLVMTPQLQQAIKLLQLSHLEMADALREELEQNPVLEEQNQEPSADMGLEEGYPEAFELTGLAPTADKDPEHPSKDVELAVDLLAITDAPLDATPEPSVAQVDADIDWNNYTDSYNFALPTSAGCSRELNAHGPEAQISQPPSLFEHLRWQVQMSGLNAEEAQIAWLLIELLDEDGYLPHNAIDVVTQQLHTNQAALVQSVLFRVQEFEPAGIAARDLKECLTIQALRVSKHQERILDIIENHLDLVQKRNYKALARQLKINRDDAEQAVQLITQFEPRPGSAFANRQPQYIVPDIYVHRIGDKQSDEEFVVSLNEDELPRLCISSYYQDAIKQGVKQDTRVYLQDKLRSAAWLLRSIHMRQRTIRRVMQSILYFQRDFFRHGVKALKPLILKDVADDVNMHESTISRVTSNKYVHTPQGIYELKYFFNSSIKRVGGDDVASESVREHILRLINQEDVRTPLSDQRIVALLKQDNIDIARRTVAKYREMLKIPSSSQRRRIH